MKTLAFVVPWYGDNIPGGAEAALRGISDHLFEAGMDVEILTTTVEKFTADWNKDFYKPGEYKSKKGIPIRRFPIRKRNVAAFDAVNAKLINKSALTPQEEETFHKEMINSPKLYDYIKEHQEDYSFFVYIPYMFGTTYWGVSACPKKSVLIPCFHDESYAHMKSFRKLYSEVAGMLFNAQPEEDLTEKLYDIHHMKTEVMGLGVDTNLTYDAARFREKFNIKDPFILYAGRKDAGKNIYTLLNYFKRFKQGDEHIGNGNQEGITAQQRAALKLVLIGGGDIEIPSEIKDSVIDLGFVDIQDKYDAYGAAELLCQPSKNESFSFVIMESWLCNRPVLVHEHCDVTRNFVSCSDGGLYFNSYFDFAGTVEYILTHKEEADQMGKNGHDYVMDHFAWDVIVDKYKRFFSELEADLQKNG